MWRPERGCCGARWSPSKSPRDPVSRARRCQGPIALVYVEPQRRSDVAIQCAQPSTEIPATPAPRAMQAQRPARTPRLGRRPMAMILAAHQYIFNAAHTRFTGKACATVRTSFDTHSGTPSWGPAGTIDHAAPVFITA